VRQDELKRVLKLYAMLRLNDLEKYPYEGSNWYPADLYDRTFADRIKDLDAFMERHFMTAGYLVASAKGTGEEIIIETSDDENLEYMRQFHTRLSRLNPCPSSGRDRELAESRLDRSIYEFGNPATYAYLHTDEMYQEVSGSRWNIDRRSLKRGISGARMFFEYLCRPYDAARRRGVKMCFINCQLTKHVESSKYHDMYTVYPLIPRDLILWTWKGKAGSPESDPEYAIDHFERSFTSNCFGFLEAECTATVYRQCVVDRRSADDDLKHIPVIAVSADINPAMIDQAISAGCAAYVAKPFDIRQLHATIRDCLDSVRPLDR